MMKSNVVPIETGRHAEDEAMRAAEHARDEALLAAEEVVISELARAQRIRNASVARAEIIRSASVTRAGELKKEIICYIQSQWSFLFCGCSALLPARSWAASFISITCC